MAYSVSFSPVVSSCFYYVCTMWNIPWKRTKNFELLVTWNADFNAFQIEWLKSNEWFEFFDQLDRSCDNKSERKSQCTIHSISSNESLTYWFLWRCIISRRSDGNWEFVAQMKPEIRYLFRNINQMYQRRINTSKKMNPFRLNFSLDKKIIAISTV